MSLSRVQNIFVHENYYYYLASYASGELAANSEF